MKMEQTQCSETSAYKIQTPGNYPEESIQRSEHGENLKSRTSIRVLVAWTLMFSQQCFLSVQVFWDMTLCRWESGCFWPLKMRAVHSLKCKGPVVQWHSITSQKVVCIQAWCSRSRECCFPLENKCYWYCLLLRSVRGKSLYKLFWNYGLLVVILF
jgi:hypothetical protein